jgi:hypothetical protein
MQEDGSDDEDESQDLSQEDHNRDMFGDNQNSARSPDSPIGSVKRTITIGKDGDMKKQGTMGGAQKLGTMNKQLTKQGTGIEVKG